MRGVVSNDFVYILDSAAPEIALFGRVRRRKGRNLCNIFERILFLKTGNRELQLIRHGYLCGTAGVLTNKMIQKCLAHHFKRDPTENFIIEQSAVKPSCASLDVRSAESTPPAFAGGCFVHREPFPPNRTATTLWKKRRTAMIGMTRIAGMLAANQFTQRENLNMVYHNSVLSQQLYVAPRHLFDDLEHKRATGRTAQSVTPQSQVTWSGVYPPCGPVLHARRHPQPHGYHPPAQPPGLEAGGVLHFL